MMCMESAEMEPNNMGRNGAEVKPFADAALPATVAGALLTATVERLGAGVFRCDASQPGCPITYVAGGFTVITRYTAAEAVGRGWALLKSPESDPVVVEQISRALTHGTKFQGELLCQR